MWPVMRIRSAAALASAMHAWLWAYLLSILVLMYAYVDASNTGQGTRTEFAGTAHHRQLMTLQQVNEAAQDSCFWSYIDLIDAILSALGAGDVPGAEAAADIIADLASGILSGAQPPSSRCRAARCNLNTCPCMCTCHARRDDC